MAKKKTETTSKKQRGENVSTGNRGIGDVYAMAVFSLKEQLNAIKGSISGFLGVEPKTIDPKQAVEVSTKKEKK